MQQKLLSVAAAQKIISKRKGSSPSLNFIPLPLSKQDAFQDATNIPMQFGPAFSIGGLQFMSPFHYYYFMKAHIFGDVDTAKKILEYDEGYWGPDWRELQKLASHVKGFNNDIWKKCQIRIAYEACKYKTLSDPYALRDLLSTYGKCLSWYMPNELVWGYVNCGEDWLNINNIHGENRMGNVLNLLRDDIIAVIENNWEWEQQKAPIITLSQHQYDQAKTAGGDIDKINALRGKAALKLDRIYSAGVSTAFWLYVVIVTPVFFNFYSKLNPVMSWAIRTNNPDWKFYGMLAFVQTLILLGALVVLRINFIDKSKNAIDRQYSSVWLYFAEGFGLFFISSLAVIAALLLLNSLGASLLTTFVIGLVILIVAFVIAMAYLIIKWIVGIFV